MHEITKIDDDKRLVFGWASIIKDAEGRVLLDRQDDYIDDEEELEKAAYTYVLHSRDGGEMHVRTGVSTMVESVVLSKEKQAALGIPEGTVPVGWWIGFRVNDDRVWDQVKKGDYVGFSVHGTGVRGQGILKDGEFTEVGKGDFPGHPFRGNQWTKGRGGGGSKAKSKPKKPKSSGGSNVPKSVRDRVKAKEKAGDLTEGKDVKVTSVKEASTILDDLKKEIDKAVAAGKEAPNVNLCKVTIPGTNLFCGANKGIPRKSMPQFSGRPEEGSPASKKTANAKGEVDGTREFEQHLTSGMGVKVTKKTMKAADLKATQTELVGPKVVGMINNKNFEPSDAEIFVSSDGYIIDGHHRWAAQIGRDTSDGKLGDLELKVRVVDMPISQIIPVANKWAKEFGIAPKEAKTNDMKKSDCGCGCTDVQVSKQLLVVLAKAQRSKTKRQKKIATVMREFKRGDLKSSSGDKVTDSKQAMAIALSEARRVDKGDFPGHPFRGNQHVKGKGGGTAKPTKTKRRRDSGSGGKYSDLSNTELKDDYFGSSLALSNRRGQSSSKVREVMADMKAMRAEARHRGIKLEAHKPRRYTGRRPSR